MKLIREIKPHEMLRRWAISEVFVEYLDTMTKEQPQEILKLLHSNDFELEKEGIARSLKIHHLSLVDCLPLNVSWFLASLETKRSEFDKFYTLPVPDMAEISDNTYKVSEAARIIYRNPLLDPRITGIRHAFNSNQKEVQLSGITILAKSFDGPYTIIEGNGRLISLYSILFFERNNVLPNNDIEIVIGISDARFEINYKLLD